MSLSDREIYDNIGSIDTSEEVPFHESEVNVLAEVLTELGKDCDTEEEFLAHMGELFSGVREHFGGTDVDDNLTKAFEAADRKRNQQDT